MYYINICANIHIIRLLKLKRSNALANVLIKKNYSFFILFCLFVFDNTNKINLQKKIQNKKMKFNL